MDIRHKGDGERRQAPERNSAQPLFYTAPLDQREKADDDREAKVEVPELAGWQREGC